MITTRHFAVSLWAALGLLAGLTASAQDAGYRIDKNIIYGTGIVDAGTTPHPRDLVMDAYLPNAGAPTAAVIMIFGGAFHRGSKEDVHYLEDGAQNSSMARYCQMLARNGAACFAIDYRLTPEDPAMPDNLPEDHRLSRQLLKDPKLTARIEVVRQRMGLPALDDSSRTHYWNATFAAVADANTALAHVRTKAGDYGVDPDRIAVGGFSAGAITALNLGFATPARVCGVVSLSGGIWGYDVTSSASEVSPPLLMFAGQHDLAGILYGSAMIAKAFPARGVDLEAAWVPGFGHFYPMGAVSLGPDYTRQSVEQRILSFLERSC